MNREKTGKQKTILYDVIGAGDIGVDIFLSVDRIPGYDEKIVAKCSERHAGGMVANFTAIISNLGLHTKLLGAVGDDPYGEFALEDLRQQGVDVDDVARIAGQSTYYCVVLLDNSGEKALIVVPTEALDVPQAKAFQKSIPVTRHIHTTAFSITQEILDAAKANGVTVSIDVEPSALRENTQMIEFIRQADIVFINQAAAEILNHGNPVEPPYTKMMNLGPKLVCITNGKNGGVVIDKNNQQFYEYSAFQVKNIDTTGAGDAFAAGFVYGFLQDWEPRNCALFASAVGAIVTTGVGGHSHAPGFSEVIRFINENGYNLEL